MEDFAKSIRTGNAYGWREKNGHQELYNPNVPFGGHTRGYVEKSKSGYVGAKTNGSIVISKKEFASEEEAKKYVENSKVGNADKVSDAKGLYEDLRDAEKSGDTSRVERYKTKAKERISDLQKKLKELQEEEKEVSAAIQIYQSF